jgi:hypothetical protein
MYPVPAEDSLQTTPTQTQPTSPLLGPPSLWPEQLLGGIIPAGHAQDHVVELSPEHADAREAEDHCAQHSTYCTKRPAPWQEQMRKTQGRTDKGAKEVPQGRGVRFQHSAERHRLQREAAH